MSKHDPQTRYSAEELMSRALRTFDGPGLREIAFPLGGIGTGCVSLGGRGQLRDWEIFNRPNQGFRPEFAFATLRAESEGGGVITKVVESPLTPPYTGTHGAPSTNGEGLPHMASNTFRGEYPFARLQFEDGAMPLKVSLEAFSPFIPLNDFDSSLPAAILTYRLENTTNEVVQGLLAWTMQNVVGYGGAGPLDRSELGGNRNAFRSEGGLNGMVLDSTRYPADSHRHGSMVLATPWQDVTYTGYIGDRSFAPRHIFWDIMSRPGGFDDTEMREPTADGQTGVCALGMRVALEPGQTAEIPLLLTWHFPNFVKYWDRSPDEGKPVWRNHYAQHFADAWSVAAYVNENLARLRAQSLQYHDALFGSTLPGCVLDAASSQTSTLKSPTCLRLEDGTFYGWEGCSATAGCCEGSCTHVWNYQQALPFLFPALQRSMRTADYAHNLREEDGRMCFRLALPRGTSGWGFHAAADGQLGGIIKTYRDWLLCGDDDWLRGLWPRVKKALAYAWEQWDTDRDGVPDGVQHNTYDIEFVGANPLIGAFYMGALRAAEEMARYLGEDRQADQYRELFEKGSARMDETLFNGEYYIQQYDPEEAQTHQFGQGCLSDQMLGQWLAAICDLGYLFDPDKVRSALQNVFRHNWRSSLGGHVNPQRIYAVNDESGLLMCTWPRGGRPLIPVAYCDEVWTGTEYQVASHLIMEGFVTEGLTIVKGARERHDGVKRNPWDEPECGSHYARAMSSWGLVLALSGYHYNAPAGLMRFAPKVRQDDFRVFWSNASAWGTYSQNLSEGSAAIRLDVLSGDQKLRRMQLRTDLPGTGELSATVEIAGAAVPCSVKEDAGWTELAFAREVTIPEGKALTASVSR